METLKWALRNLRDYNDAFSAIQSLATCIAFAFGGYWSWRAFIRKRLSFPMVSVTLEIHSISVSELMNLVRVVANIVNKGEVLLKIGSAKVFLQMVTPCAPESIEAFTTPNEESDAQAEAEWPLVGRTFDLKYSTPHEIEPGESDSFPFDFFVPKNVTTVIVNSHFANLAKMNWRHKKTEPIGWNNYAVFSDFPPSKLLCPKTVD